MMLFSDWNDSDHLFFVPFIYSVLVGKVVAACLKNSSERIYLLQMII